MDTKFDLTMALKRDPFAAKQAVRNAFALENAFLVQVQEVLTESQRNRVVPTPTLVVPDKALEDFR